MLLECRDLIAAYGRSGVLHGVSLGVPPGVVFAMIGRNGMGKTTFAHVVTGLMRSTGGSITFDGNDVTGQSPERISNLGISLVPQGHRVFPSLTVRENLEVASRPGGQWDVDKVVERFPILRERWTQHAGVLSGGQQQMLTIARALVRNPRLIIMDEPSEGLDPERVGVVRGVIAELRELGTAVLLIEQKIQLVLDVADTVAVMSRGEIVQFDPIEKHRQNPELMASHLGFI